MVNIPDHFVGILQQKFQKAVEDETLLFNGDASTTQMLYTELNGSRYKFHVTELQSLQHRPELGSVLSNPFSKPEPELTILSTFGDKDEFRIVLNKFPVVPYHFMLVTKEFKSQNTPLSPNELMATFTILKKLASDDKNRKWFSFYNCGPQSGASQPHKHVQFMSFPPGFLTLVDKLVQSSEYFVPDLDHEPLQDKNLPFAHFVAKLPTNINDISEEGLAMIFVSLLQRTLTVLRDNDCDHISYNFCATTEFMMLIPRSGGKYKELGVNSCGYLGLVLCKNPKLVNLVTETGFEHILGALSFPNTTGLAIDEYHY